MNDLFQKSAFVIKRQGLAIGGKYKLFGLNEKEPLLFIEEKSSLIPLSISIHAYADEKKNHEVLLLKDQPSGGSEDLDVFDGESGQKIGSLLMDAENVSEIFKDVWSIQDAEGHTVGRVLEKKLGYALMRELVAHDIPQRLVILAGEVEVGELRQKTIALFYEMKIDLRKDVSGLLDRRLAIAAGILVAIHQGKEVDF
jgi:hypothetical protein